MENVTKKSAVGKFLVLTSAITLGIVAGTLIMNAANKYIFKA